MTNSEMELMITKLVMVTKFLAQEVAALVDDRADRTKHTAAPGIRARAQEIRDTALELQTLFDEVV